MYQNYITLVSYNSKTGKIEWLKAFKKELPEITEDLDLADKTFRNFVETAQNSGTVYKTSKEALAGYQSYLQSTSDALSLANIKTAALSASMKVLSNIGWTAIFTAASWAIGKTIEAIDHWVHADENAIETAAEANNHISQINATYEAHKKTVEDCASAYDELSKGIDRSTNRNVSLNAEDYQKFLELNSQLAETFPGLISTIDENGNAILNFGDKSHSSAEYLREFLETEQDLNNYKISENINDVFAGVKVQVSRAIEDQKAYEEELQKTNNSLTALKDLSSIETKDIVSFDGDILNEGDSSYYRIMSTSIQELYKKISADRRARLADTLDVTKLFNMPSDGTAFSFYFDVTQLNPDEKSLLKSIIQKQSDDVIGTLTDSIGRLKQEQSLKINEAELAWKDFIPNLVATMKSKSTFKDLDETSQEIAIHLVNGLQMSIIDQMDQNTPYEYVRDQIIAPLSKLSESDLNEVANAYKSLFSLDTDSLPIEEANKKINDYISIISNKLNKDSKELKIQFGFENIEDVAKNYHTVLQKAAEKFSGESALSAVKGIGEKYQKEYSSIEEFAKKNSINTQNEIAFWDQCIKESNTRAEAMRKYLQGASSVNESSLSYSDTINELNKMSDAFKALDAAYSDFVDKDKNISFEDISSLSDKFKDVTGIEGYVRAIQEAKGNTLETQEAFDNLLTAYMNQSGILEEVNEGNSQLIESYLSEQGVANADIIVQEALAHSLEMVSARKYYNATASAALDGATVNEINRILQEADAAGISRSALIELEMAKIFCNEAGIVTDGDIQNLIDLATAAGIAKAAIIDAKTAQYQKNASGVARSAGAEQAINNSISENLQKGIREDLYKPTKYTYSGGTATNSSRGKSDGGGGSKGSDTVTATAEDYDWIETRLKRVDEQIDKLKKKAEDAIGWQNKNLGENTVLDQLQNKLTVLNSSFDVYMEKAKSVGLSDFYIQKIQDGSMDIESISDENIKTMISDYTDLYNKALDCKNEIDEVHDSIKETKELKLDNIMNDYDQLISLLDKYTDYQRSLVELRDKQGKQVDEDDYLRLIADQKQIYDQLSEEYKTLESAFLYSGIEKGTEKWHEMREELVDLKSQMLDCQSTVEDFKDTIIEMRFKPLEDLVNKLDAIDSEISDMSSLMGEDGLTLHGMITDKGLAKIALYQQQLISSKKKSAEYSSAVKALTEIYENGDMTLDEYHEKLYEYQSAQRQSALATKEAKDAIIALNIDAIEEQIDDMNELIQTKKDALNAEEDLYQYQKKIADDTKNISILETQIAMLKNATDNKSKAQRLQLEQDLQEAREKLENDQRDHSLDAQQDALDKEGEAYEKAKKDEIDNLKTNLEAQDAAINQYLTDVKNNYSVVYDELTQYAETYHMDVTDFLLSPFESATSATQSYVDAISNMVSQINYEISKINWSNLSGNTSGFDESDFTDISDTGKWQKGQGDKWWYGEAYREDGNYNYASNGIYTIKGHQYGFDDQGYMLTGWNDNDGSWRFFEPENGQMVKSTWRQDKNGDYYYLQSDGTMATNASVKANDGSGYFIVDADGKWDGQTVLDPDFDRYPLAYKNGTRRVNEHQLAWTQEEEPEFIVRPSENAVLTKLKPGDGVLKGDWSRELFKFASNPQAFLMDHMPNLNLRMPKFASDNTGMKVEINAPLMKIDGTLSPDMQHYVDQKCTELKNDMPKVISNSMNYSLMGK